MSAAALTVLGGFVFGKDFVSYMRTGAKSVRHAVKSEVPLDFEVQRAREMVEHLVPDIRNSMHVIAEQQVDLEDLVEKIDDRKSEMNKQERAIMSLRTDLGSGDTQFVYASLTYTADEVKQDLSQRFERFKLAEETLGRDKQILRARENALAANREKLEGMLAEKHGLEVQLEQLEARLKSIQAAETVSNLEFDNSQLARAKTLIRELNKQLDVKEKILDAEGKFTGLIPVETDSKLSNEENVVQQIDDYFGNDRKSEAGTKIVDLDSL